MKVIQISDLHLTGENQSTYNDVNVWDHFRKLMAHIEGVEHDLLICTGDFCFKEPRTEIYQEAAPYFENHKVPSVKLAGNHDDTEMLFAAFNTTRDQEFYSKAYTNTTLHFIASEKGSYSQNQINKIKNILAQSKSNKPNYFFTHYPPILCGVQYMDQNHAVRNHEELTQFFSECDHVIHLFCGHYHCERTVKLGNLHVHICPSPYFNLKAESSKFQIDNYKVGYRLIEIDDKGILIKNEVKYLG